MDCGKDISHRGNRAKRCEECLGPVNLRKVERSKAYQKLYRKGINAKNRKDNDLHPERNTIAALAGCEYDGQSITADGNFFTILYKCKYRRVSKICNYCKRDEQEVRGEWAPIFSEFNDRGQELEIILLCLECYDLACDYYLRHDKEAS
jgi:hypothetical protein